MSHPLLFNPFSSKPDHAQDIRPERAPEADADLLARLYGFTAREAAVAALLLKGRSPSEAAEELALRDNTVRTHIRHVFDKTGVGRLADLVLLLMQGPGVHGR